MELRTLQYFLAVAREENISRAAEKLHLTQPTLSRQMMDLEAELGNKLLVRGKRRVTLTQDGLLLRKRAAEMVDLMDKTRSELRGSSEEPAGDVYIGAGETDGVRLLARAAREVTARHPQVRFHIVSGDGADISERLDRGLIDFALYIGAVPGGCESLRLPVEDVWGALLPAGHPLCAKDTVSPEDLRREKLILSRQTENGSAVTHWLGRRTEELNIVATYSLIYNASLLVEEGCGVALCLDKLIDARGSRPLEFRPCSPDLKVDVYLAWKKGQVFSQAAEAYLEAVRRTV